MDVVEVSPNTTPPVCRIMDYGRFQFDQKKKFALAKKKQKQTQVKEIKFRPTTDIGDYRIKMRKITEFLSNGDRVKITLRFRGREITLPEVARQEMDEISSSLSDIGHVEVAPSMEGRTMLMIIAPGEAKHPSQTNE